MRGTTLNTSKITLLCVSNIAYTKTGLDKLDSAIIRATVGLLVSPDPDHRPAIIADLRVVVGSRPWSGHTIYIELSDIDNLEMRIKEWLHRQLIISDVALHTYKIQNVEWVIDTVKAALEQLVDESDFVETA